MVLKANQYLTYRGKPLVRQNNLIYYGSMSDPYVLFLMILSNKKVTSPDGKVSEIPDQIMVQLVSTDKSKSVSERTVKQYMKNGLYDAMDIGTYWLNKLNSGK